MNVEDFREFCLYKAHVTESLPFGEETLVFKLNGKIFALLSLVNEPECNLKCDPEYAISLREEYEGIIPGYHMNKKHWNTIRFHSDVNDKFFYDLIDHSYSLILNKFSKKIQKELAHESTN